MRPGLPGALSRREGSAPRGAGMGNGPHPLCPRGPRAYFDGPYGGLCSTAARSKNTALRSQNISTRHGTIIRDAAHHVATNSPVPTVDGQRAGKGGHGDARGGDGGWATGGEIFAKTAKTPPLQSAFAGISLRSKCCPIAAAMRVPCTPHAPHLRRPYGFYNGAAWLGRALAALGTSPTKSAIANLEN